MTPLETYLQNATKGLARAQREIVRAELEGNLEIRAREFQVQGLSASDAMHRALEEIGAANHVQRGMLGVYIWPRAARQTILLLMAMWCCTSPLSLVTARVQAVAVKDASGRIVNVQLEPFAFSSALERFGFDPRTLDQHLPSSFGIARAWRANSKAPFANLSGVYPLDWSDAKRFLCTLGRKINLESDPRAIVFRLESPQLTFRLQLELQPGDAARWRATLQDQDLECVP
jgi:hypothetical protein